MKKRIISALICLAVMVALGGCAQNGVPQDTASAGAETQSASAQLPDQEDLVDNFEESIDVDGLLVRDPEVPLAPSIDGRAKVKISTPKVTRKKSKGRLKKPAASSKKVTKTRTAFKKQSSVNEKNTVLKETTTVTTKETIYKRGSRTTNITTTVKKSIKTTTTPVVVDTSGKIKTAASKADPRLLQRFEDEGYEYVINTGLEYIGLFSSRNKAITMRYQSDIIYHELGHYLAYTTGLQDKTSEWENIYAREANKFEGDNKAYVTSSAREYFAECYRDYVTRKSTLKSKRPQSYQYIEKVLDML